ncbi:MAG: GNAT family N-acetyltransferase [Dehalococcoidia bacterium]|jgi:N-acetylglutamate synthase-like GNAT family acetyltransferase
MSVEYVIAEASEGDAELLAALIGESFATVAERFALTPESSPTHPSNCQPEWIQTAFARGVRYYLLRTSGQPAGCVALERVDDDKCYMERLAVLPAYRRRGFGEALVNHIVATAREMGLQAVEIGTIAAQTELRAWYERQGFVATSTRHFESLPFDVTFMRKELTENPARSEEPNQASEDDVRACGSV